MKNIISQKSFYLISIIVIGKILFGFSLQNFNPEFFFTTDSYEYINPASQICENGNFNNINNEPEIRRTPGTSIFLLPAVCFNLNLSRYMVILNMVMVLFAAYFTYKIVKLINIKINPLFIFLIYLIDPTLSKHQYNILSDIIFLFSFTLTLYFFLYGLKNNNSYLFFSGFALIAVSTFIRPITLYLPIFLLLFFILFYLFNSSFRVKFTYTLLIASLLGLILHFSLTQLWSYRNFKETGVKEFTYLKSQHNYLYKTAGIIAKKEQKNFSEVQEEFIKKVDNFSKVEFIDYSNGEIKKAILSYPLETVIVGLEGAMMTLFTPGTGQYPRMFKINQKYFGISKIIFNSAGFLWIFVLSLFALYGIIKIDKNMFFLFIILIFIYLILASSSPGSYSRFRIPFMPLIIVFICCGYENFINRIKKIKKKRIFFRF